MKWFGHFVPRHLPPGSKCTSITKPSLHPDPKIFHCTLPIGFADLSCCSRYAPKTHTAIWMITKTSSS